MMVSESYKKYLSTPRGKRVELARKEHLERGAKSGSKKQRESAKKLLEKQEQLAKEVDTYSKNKKVEVVNKAEIYAPNKSVLKPSVIEKRAVKVQPEKDRLAGFKKRIERVKAFEEKVAARSDKIVESKRSIPGLKGDSWLSGVGREVISFPEKAALGLFGAGGTILGKTALTVEGLIRPETRKATVQQLGVAGKKTPAAVRDQYVTLDEDAALGFRITPQQAVNIVTTVGSVYALGKMRSYHRSKTIKPGSEKITKAESVKTPGGRNIKGVEKGSFQNVKGQKFTYEKKSSVSIKTGKGTFKQIVRDSSGKIVESQAGKITPQLRATKSLQFDPRRGKAFIDKTKFTPEKGMTKTRLEFGKRTPGTMKTEGGQTTMYEKVVSDVKITGQKPVKSAVIRKSVSTTTKTTFQIKQAKIPQTKTSFSKSFKTFSDKFFPKPKPVKTKTGFLGSQKGSLSIGRGDSFSSRFDPSSRFGGVGVGKPSLVSVPKPVPVKFQSFTPVKSVPLMIGTPQSIVPIVPFSLVKTPTKTLEVSKPVFTPKPSGKVWPGSQPKYQGVYEPGLKPGVDSLVDPVVEPVVDPGVDVPVDDSVFSRSRPRPVEDLPVIDAPVTLSPTPLTGGGLPIPPLVFRTPGSGGVGLGGFFGRTKVSRFGKYKPSLRASSFNIRSSKPVKGSFTGLTERPIIEKTRKKY